VCTRQGPALGHVLVGVLVVCVALQVLSVDQRLDAPLDHLQYPNEEVTQRSATLTSGQTSASARQSNNQPQLQGTGKRDNSKNSNIRATVISAGVIKPYLGIGAEEGQLGEDLGHQLLVLQGEARLRSVLCSTR
jgi:hypothetical protein